MKTLNTKILTLAAVAVLGTTGLYAQTGAVATIPFDFTVQSVTMPAGGYTLRSLAGPSGLMQLTNNETRKSILVLAPCTGASHDNAKAATGEIGFHRYGDRYFFADVWTPNGLSGHVAPSKLERELQASRAEKEVASVSIPVTLVAAAR